MHRSLWPNPTMNHIMLALFECAVHGRTHTQKARGIKENGVKADNEHRQGHQHQKLLDTLLPGTSIPKNWTLQAVFTVDIEAVCLEATSSPAVDSVVHVPPTVLQLAFNAVSVDAKPAPAKATRNKRGKAKPLAKASAKRPKEQTTLTQMDLENDVDFHSIGKGQ